MRRARHKLQVSTFPFLAVLLGAMGALILLLLVMDRRSKVVARNRAIAAHAEQLAARSKKQDRHVQDEEARRAEWERERQKLHDLLRGQEKELALERDNLGVKLQNLSQDLQKETNVLRDLETKLLAERGRLDLKGQLLSQMRQGLARYNQRENESKAEVEKLARELAQLERAWQEAKALKAQDRETYSLVPYRGKLGEGRRPVYIECAAPGLIFHPDGQTLDNSTFDIRAFRDEVQHHGVELVRDKREADRPNRPAAPKVNTNPYVLFLIRPDGLESYYHGLSALRGFDLDFGYEFLDAEWVLNFSGESGFNGQKLAGSAMRPESSRPPPKNYASQDLPPPPPLVGPDSNPSSSAQAGSGQYGGPGIGPGIHQPSLGTPGPGNNSGPGTGGYAQTGTGRYGGAGVGKTGFGSPVPDNIAGPGTPNVVGQVASLNGQSYAPGGSFPGKPVNAGSPTSLPKLASPETGTPDGPGSASNNSGPGNSVDTPDFRASLSGPGTNSANRTGGTDSTIKGPAGVEADGSPGQTAARGSAGPGSNSSPSASNKNSGNSAKNEDPDAVDPLARLAPKSPLMDSGANPKRPPPAPSLGRLFANRDYVMTIECYGNVLALYPGGQVYAMTNEANQKNIDEALVQAVLQLVARRQATVRPGESPYRPMLRFQVHPEALRTYIHVYPLFENLHMPMTRENLDS